MNIASLLHEALRESRRPPDGLLHPSSDLMGSLRHSQLRLAGAPTIESEIVSDIRLMTGTLWHEKIAASLVRAGVPFMQEVKLTKWLPEGWSGTADGVFWESDLRGFLLRDYKTIKGEGMKWVLKEGAKQEHLWQGSTYWHALFDSGLPMVNEFEILYWPMNDTTDREENIEPIVMSCTPLDRELVHGVMADRWAKCQAYLASLEALDDPRWALIDTSESLQEQPVWFLTEQLAAEQARVQKFMWSTQQQVFDVKLVPHWSSEYCPYPTELCACSEQGTTKIGHFTMERKYEPRKGYEDVLPMVQPEAADYSKAQRKLDRAAA